jgi:hypothetical protein
VNLHSLAELPAKAAPFTLFLFATAFFSEVYLRLPTNTPFQDAIYRCVGVLMVAAGVMFFVKCLFNIPPMKGLDLDSNGVTRSRPRGRSGSR